MGAANRVYSAEFKMSAVKEYLESGLSARKFSKDNDIKYQTFFGWLEKYKKSSSEEQKKLIEITTPLKELVNATATVDDKIEVEINELVIKIKPQDLKTLLMKND